MSKMKPLTIVEALQLLKNGVLTAEELILKCRHHLQKLKDLNMFVTEMPESSIKAQLAAAVNRKGITDKKRLLRGIPIGFKDNFCTRDAPTTCASRMLLNYRPPYNATMVQKCLDHGAIAIGKTNMDEFAMGSGTTDSCHGPVKNPWSLVVPPPLSEFGANKRSDQLSDQESIPNISDWYIAGGSSGGSAAAVASGVCLGAFGSDTGGSVRIPASFCGIVGLKPTYGLLSRHGLIPLVNSLDVPGIFTRTAEDCTVILNAVAGHDLKDSTTVQDPQTPFYIKHDLDISKLHIGIPKEFHTHGLSSEVVNLWTDIADLFEDRGARVSQVSIPNAPSCIFCYQVLCCCEVASNFSRYDGVRFGLRDGSEISTEELYAESRHKGFNDVVRGRILAGNFFLLRKNYESFFVKAQKVRRLIFSEFKDAFSSGIDLLLTPTTLTDAPTASWFASEDNRSRSEQQDIFTTSVNLAGLPAVSLPLQLSQRGLPLSLQLIGPHFSETNLLSVAHWLEQEVQFPHLNLDILDEEKVSI